ncbi:DEAD/DEAH box helicase [Aquiflexum gelatinilyticum]|uniref:DEAD/DEAH box helicase n=1 Tax=Aquiflexum gelatinilyticum TaxID=2961943 RepID=UPI0021697B67|nr:ATP-binding protein [Aquiflexum gelatinilyticum]MCS4432848.1 AAA domain-containing protein [Aquiflexum gelatinilyticum]
MTELNEILTNFPEEAFQYSFSGKIITGAIKWGNKPILLKAEQIESNQILFSFNKSPLRVTFSNSAFNAREFEISKLIQSLFWITNLRGDTVEINFLPCGISQAFNDSLEIGFGDNIILANKSVKIEKLSDNLTNDFVFKSNNSEFIFIQTYPGKTEQSFTIHGSRKRVDIIVQDNKWIVQKITNKPFTKKHGDFLLLNVAQYPSIKFVEASKAKEAYETIKAEEAKGNTLISLWQTYSAIELERANQLKEKLGELAFIRTRFLPDGITKVRIKNLTEELKSLINESKDDLLNTSFELSVEEETKATDKKRYLSKSISNDFSFELYDELSSIPEEGKIVISLIGDEIVNKRRERALKSLREDRKFITRNLLFAIEGAADAMLDKKRKEKPLSERTRKFLKDKFGVDDLTTNQKEAVEIAINTPDIAIIQGPPGTGKSTVVAAICDRLIEIAEQGKKNYNGKLILVSAFQNDTVEHIASKIYTLGLPTIKIGKETQSNIRAEDKLIEEIKLHIDNSLQRLSTKGSAHRISLKLSDIKAIYLTENNEEKLKQDIETLLSTIEINDELWNEWNEINGDRKFNELNRDKNIAYVKGIRIELEAYNDDGFYKIQRLLKSDLPFSDDEKTFLTNCPIDNPDLSTLHELGKIQEFYLEQLNNSATNISGNNLSILSWIKKTIGYFKHKEETLYEDEETFLTANLEVLRDELDGNADYIRNTIKDYGESLAATNQVAGGKEMSSYSNIDNVILEEAARSNPLDLLIPMAKATERIIMVGDQNQLPHLLEDDIAEETSTKLSDRFVAAETRKKLEESLFGVIFKNLHTANPQRTITLTEQFRMHPFIGDFISKVYYKNELKAGIPNQAELKRHRLELSWAKDKVAVFFDVKKNSGLEQSGKSKSRNAESQRIIKLLDDLKTDPNFENLSVGIITFYAKQVDDIFKEATKKGYAEIKADGNYEITLQYRETPDGREKLRIGSVDSFQGKEFDIVILSTVRSNIINRNHDNYKKVFGFLTLENRLNVAFSRAQKLLIVAGDGEMFSDEFGKTYVEGLYEFYTNLSTDSIYGNRI